MSEPKPITLREFFVGAYRIVVIIGVSGLVATLWLWSDRHNDERYVKQVDAKTSITDVGDERYLKKDEYLGNKQAVSEKLQAIEKQATDNSSKNEQKLDGIQRDIKDILWRVGGSITPPDHR